MTSWGKIRKDGERRAFPSATLADAEQRNPYREPSHRQTWTEAFLRRSAEMAEEERQPKAPDLPDVPPELVAELIEAAEWAAEVLGMCAQAEHETDAHDRLTAILNKIEEAS